MARYSRGAAARILRVSPTRLRYWERIELVRLRSEIEERMSLPQPDEDGHPGFGFRDLVTARAVLSLIEQGISLRRIRRSVDELRQRLPELDEPLTALRLWADGSPRVVVRHDGSWLEPDGQLLLDFLGEEPPSVTELERARHEAETRDWSTATWFERGCQLDGDPRTYEEAADAFRRAIELAPGFADAYCNLGAVLYNQGRRADARASFERCLEECRTHVEGNFNLANMLEEEGADQAALRHYLEAWRADPDYPDLHVHLALVYEKLGMREQGGVHWARYLDLDPEGAWASIARERLGDA